MSIADLTGTVVGNGQYRLRKKLGSGGFGTVYLADEMVNGLYVRDVAIKLYSTEATESGYIDGMLQDCALPAKILNSDIPASVKEHFVQIYSFGVLDTPEGKNAYVSMELVQNGQTLESIMQHHKEIDDYPREERIVDYMKQFFTALSAAHKAGVLHRDIKGENVMVSNGVLKIMDFGCGTYTDRTGTQIKTTDYIKAPENFDGRHTIASDIYQAGLLFYQMYTGCTPFLLDRLHEVQTDEEKRLLRSNFKFRDGGCFPGAHPSRLLDKVLCKCLKYWETDRYQSADEILDDLKQDDLRTAEEALFQRDYDTALKTAESVIAYEGTPAEDMIRACLIASKAQNALSQWIQAVESGKRALQIAQEIRLPVHDPKMYNKILNVIIIAYSKQGQTGMARLYENKKV